MTETVTDDDLIDRATKAYYRRSQYLDQPSAALCRVFVKAKTQYVLLANGHRTLAIYKVTTDGTLKGLLAPEWPKGFD